MCPVAAAWVVEMAQCRIKIAGAVASVNTLFESTPQIFKAYWTEEGADFSVTVSPENLVFEQEQLDLEAREEGFRRRQFTDPFLERAAIQRAFAEHLLDRNVLLTHGSAIAAQGMGYLFLARSGTGKSTHTRLWREHLGSRAVMINDDKPFLAVTEKGVLAYGSPWSGKHGLDSNICVPLQGICILERGRENRIWSIEAADALPMLQKETYQSLDSRKKESWDALVRTLASSVPLWRMTCTPEQEAAQVAFTAMSNP